MQQYKWHETKESDTSWWVSIIVRNLLILK